MTIGLINSFIPEREITAIEFGNVEMQGQTKAPSGYLDENGLASASVSPFVNQ